MLALSASAGLGCTTVLGDFSIEDQTGSAEAGPTLDAADRDVGSVSPGHDASADGGTARDAAADIGPPDVGPPGAPGFGLSAGAAIMKSAKFKVYAVLGESPGGNTVSKSASYTMHGGVIGATK